MEDGQAPSITSFGFLFSDLQQIVVDALISQTIDKLCINIVLSK